MPPTKTITVISPFFFPEDTAIGLYTTQFSRFLVEKGYDVKIITGFPNYPQWQIHDAYTHLPSYYSETVDTIEIIRYKQFIPKTVNLKGRILMMIDLFYGTFINLRKISNTDLVICIVPFTLSILPALFLSKLKKAKLWVHIQDFEFDLALDSKIINVNNRMSRLLKKGIISFEKKMLNSANIISSISFSMLNKIKEKEIKIEPYYFPNWVSSEKINPESSSKHWMIDSTKFCLLYSGNIGEKQDWELLHQLCHLITPNDGIEIIVVGDGGYCGILQKKLKQFSFINYYKPVPYDELNDLLCSADAHFLFQKNDIFDSVMPSKILGMMASQKPSILSGNENSEVLTIISQSGGGFYFCENDALPIYNTLMDLKKNPILSKEIGKKARNYILSTFSERVILDDFYSKIKNVLS
jgi:colanic acid biosynthesis glycosyl transferase WcaI